MQATKSTPFIDICTRITESCRCPREQLEQLAPSIGQLIKKGIGINARGMAVYVAGRLALKWRSLLVNAVGKMMAPMMPLMIDASDALRNEAAGSMPFLLNAASDKTKQNFLDRAQKLYLQARNDDQPNVIGRVLSKSITKFGADFYPFVAPLVYLGQFDPVDGAHFTGIWEQGYFKLRHIGQECADLILLEIKLEILEASVRLIVLLNDQKPNDRILSIKWL